MQTGHLPMCLFVTTWQPGSQSGVSHMGSHIQMGQPAGPGTSLQP